MNLSPKILLTIYLEGVVVQGQQEELIPFTNIKQFNGNIVSGNIPHKSKVTTLCYKKVVLTKEAYDQFIDDFIVPEHISASKWRQLNNFLKISFHCSKIAEGKEFKFELIN